MRAWALARRGAATACAGDGVRGVRTFSECRWLRASASLRQFYLDAHAGRPPLHWYDLPPEPPQPRPSSSGNASAARPRTLTLRVALHRRRDYDQAQKALELCAHCDTDPGLNMVMRETGVAAEARRELKLLKESRLKRPPREKRRGRRMVR